MIRHVLGNEASGVRFISARFTAPVTPGDLLQVHIWKPIPSEEKDEEKSLSSASSSSPDTQEIRFRVIKIPRDGRDGEQKVCLEQGVLTAQVRRPKTEEEEEDSVRPPYDDGRRTNDQGQWNEMKKKKRSSSTNRSKL